MLTGLCLFSLKHLNLKNCIVRTDFPPDFWGDLERLVSGLPMTEIKRLLRHHHAHTAILQGKKKNPSVQSHVPLACVADSVQDFEPPAANAASFCVFS